MGCCSLGCCSAGTPVLPILGDSFPSRDDDAQDFLDVVVVKGSSGVTRTQSGRPQRHRAREALTHLRFAGYTFFLGICCPVLFFVCLLPLATDGLPHELWSLYYFSLTAFLFLSFAFHVAWLSLGRGPSVAVTAVFYLSVVAMNAVASAVPVPCIAFVIYAVVSPFACLYFPSTYLLSVYVLRGAPLKHALAHMLGLTIGAVPPGLAGIYYALLYHLGWRDKAYILYPALFLWSLTPLALKTLGKRVWIRAAPAVPGMAPVLWIYYAEVAFSCFGFAIFMHTPASTIFYALSLVPMLLFQGLRGTERAFRRVPCMGTLTLHRLMLYLDAFAAVMGRIAAYTLYMSFGVLMLFMPEQGTTVSRYSLIRGGPTHGTLTINVYGLQGITPERLWVGVGGLILVVSVYVAFSLILPTAWKLDDGSVPGAVARQNAWDCTTPEPDRLDAGGEAVGEPARDCSAKTLDHYCAGGGGDEGRPAPSSAPAAPESEEATLRQRTGWLESANSSISLVFTQQHEVVLKFIGDFLRYMVLTLVFVFGVSTLIINLVLALFYLRYRDACFEQY